MSLQYIIDGYNVVKHPRFFVKGASKDPQAALIELIRSKHLCGSRKNNVQVVFDGYPATGKTYGRKDSIEIVFSKDQSADEKIKKIVEGAQNPRSCVVVSDDKEIRFVIKAAGAVSLSVEDFIGVTPRKSSSGLRKEDSTKADLNYSQMDKINKELSKIWLK